jgi:hypothetical protein
VSTCVSSRSLSLCKEDATQSLQAQQGIDATRKEGETRAQETAQDSKDKGSLGK